MREIGLWKRFGARLGGRARFLLIPRLPGLHEDGGDLDWQTEFAPNGLGGDKSETFHMKQAG